MKYVATIVAQIVVSLTVDADSYEDADTKAYDAFMVRPIVDTDYVDNSAEIISIEAQPLEDVA